MRIAVVCLVSLVVAVGLVHSVPVNPSSSQEVGSQGGDALVRDKRTVGFLRDLFPNFSQMIDRKIQMLTRLVFRVIGRLVLQGGGGGGGGGGSDSDERRVSITLPTYPPSADDEDEDEDEDEDTEPPSPADSDSAASDVATTIKSEEADEDNSVAESKLDKVRVKREGESDLNVEATGDNNEVSDDAESEEDEDEDPRNKRFLNFNLGGSASASSGGSGNFLFDIIRLVAGSGSTQETDESSNAAIEEAKDESSYGFGVPGPLTRLFVIANRGVASLIQDLILRLAQTSERIVNFKARLITSII